MKSALELENTPEDDEAVIDLFSVGIDYFKN